MRTEGDVRQWLRATAKLAEAVMLVWCEQANGATAGAPDVLFYLGGLGLPVELKFWDRLRSGLFASRLRPVQVRYHAVMAKRGKPTLLLWGTPGSDHVWALAGHRAPTKASDRIDAASEHVRSYSPWGRAQFVADIADAAFWRGWRPVGAAAV